MQPPKTPLAVLLASFFTFVLAFGGLAVLGKYGKLAGVQEGPDATTAPVQTGSIFAPEHPDDHPDSDAEEPSSISKPTTQAFVRGRVIDREGNPIANATAAFLLAHRAKAGKNNPPIKVLQTDENGEFRCHPRTLPEKFRLVVRAPGCCRWDAPAVELGGRRQVELGDIQLGPGAALIFTVRDEDGAAVENATVLVRDPERETQPHSAREDLHGTTNALGVLALDGADFGQYEVTVTKAGHAPFEHTFSYTAEEGREEYSIEASLPAATSYIEGAVADAAGYPVREGKVAVEPLHPPGGISTRYGGEIDHRGHFRIGPLPRGDYKVLIDSEGLMLRSPTYGEADGQAVRMVVQYGGIVFGTVSCPEGAPRSLELELWSRDSRGRLSPYNGSVKSAIDRSNGRFEIDGLAPGTYQLRATAARWAAARSRPFSIGAGERRQGVELELSDGGKIQGIVLGARCEPLAGVRITAFEGTHAPPPALASLFIDSGQASAVSDAEGNFEFAELSPGPHVLLIEAKDLPMRTLGPLEVQASSEIRLGHIGLGSGGSISGTLNDTADQAVPFGRVVISSTDQEVWMIVQTDEAGNFSAQGLDAGDYRLQAPRDSSEGILPDAWMALKLSNGEHARQALVQTSH